MIPFPETVELDDDGYPTVGWLTRLSQSNDIAFANRWMVDTFPHIVETIGYGGTEVYQGVSDFGHPITVIKYSTGGWSGQEDFIGALARTPIRWMYLWSWRRGGHYEFRIAEVRK